MSQDQQYGVTRPEPWQGLWAVFLVALLFCFVPGLAQQAQANTDQAAPQTAAEITSGKALQQFRAQSIDLAQKIQEGEAAIASLASEHQTLKKQYQAARHEALLQADKVEHLISSLQHLAAKPTQELLFLTEEPAHSVHTAMLLTDLYRQMQTELTVLNQSAAQAKRLRAAVAEKLALKRERQGVIEKERADLLTLISQRQALYKEQHKAVLEKQQALLKKASQTKSVQSLIHRLAEVHADKEQAAHSSTAAGVRPPARPVRVSLQQEDARSAPSRRQSGGRMPYLRPVTGKIIRGFGSRSEYGMRNRGLTFRPPPAATVVAPYAGKVLYAGTFRGYGNVVIIEHKNGLHTVLAGMEHIDIGPGQHLDAGEPIGRMRDQATKTSELYLEIRRNGNPVNPKSWLRT